LAQRGEEELTSEERRQRKTYLQKAEAFFVISGKMDPRYLTAEINTLCVMVLQGKASEAISYYSRHELSKKAMFLADRAVISRRARMALALAYVYNNDGNKAVRIWKNISNNNSDILAFQADYNLKVWLGEECNIKETIHCPDLSDTKKLIDGVKLHRAILQKELIDMSNENGVMMLSISEKPSSLLYTFETDGNYFSLQRIFQPPTVLLGGHSAYSMITNTGSITSCAEGKVAFLSDQEGDVVEWAKYY
jgi:hypothetical protein